MTSAQSHKFNLYLKARQMSQVKQAMGQVQHMEPVARQAWMKDNSTQVEQAFDHFIDESNQALNHVGLDEESLKLSQTIVQGLRDSMTMVNHVVYRQQELES
ncbi:MAG: hypothetical protein ABIJ03_03600 [Patescibacteria group bacterium]